MLISIALDWIHYGIHQDTGLSRLFALLVTHRRHVAGAKLTRPLSSPAVGVGRASLPAQMLDGIPIFGAFPLYYMLLEMSENHFEL